MITATTTPAGMIAEARAVLCTVQALTWPQDRDERRPLAEASILLGDAIDTYECLEGALIHWESQYPELRDVTDEPESEALRVAAEDARESARVLTEAAAKACPDAGGAQ